MSKSKAKPKAKPKVKAKAKSEPPTFDIGALDKKTQEFVSGLIAEVARLKKQTSAKANKRRADWQLHDDALELSAAKMMLSASQIPTYAAIARDMGCDVNTVKRHVKEMSFEDRFAIWRLATPFVIQNLFKQATQGTNPKHIDSWLEKIEGIGKKVDVTSGGQSMKALNVIVQDKETKDEVDKLK
jgi:hypothetical protein